MPKIEQKQVVVTEIKEKLAGAVSIVLVDSRGLTVSEDTQLRKDLREAGVVYKVYKNSMVNFALEGTDFEGLKDQLKGPSAIAIAYEDPTIAARTISKSAKKYKALEFKAGIIDGVLYDAQGLQTIADIPSREELLSKLLGSFKSPLSSFARLIQAIADDSDTQEAVPAAE